jgi:hypothetical protein
MLLSGSYNCKFWGGDYVRIGFYNLGFISLLLCMEC